MVLADGEKIRELRTDEGWSAADLAVKAGAGRTSIYYIEAGRPCKAVVLARIAKALGVPARKITAKTQRAA